MTTQISNGVNNEAHCCKIHRGGFALAAAGVIGALYVLCAAFVSLWPEFSLKLFGWLIHLVNVDKFAGDVRVTLAGFVWGLVQTAVYAYVIAWLIAWLHNKFSKTD